MTWLFGALGSLAAAATTLTTVEFAFAFGYSCSSFLSGNHVLLLIWFILGVVLFLAVASIAATAS